MGSRYAVDRLVSAGRVSSKQATLFLFIAHSKLALANTETLSSTRGSQPLRAFNRISSSSDNGEVRQDVFKDDPTTCGPCQTSHWQCQMTGRTDFLELFAGSALTSQTAAAAGLQVSSEDQL